MKKYIFYFRVSTTKQGFDGLGMAAQRSAVATYGKPIAEFSEVESGRKSRPQLDAAIAECKRTGATLVIAKLDRLYRSVALTSALMESGIEFICADNPNATRLTIHILAAVAEDESRRIGARTSAAIAANKARGNVCGGDVFTVKQRRQGGHTTAQQRTAMAIESYKPILPVMQEMRDKGESLESIAKHLNSRGGRTSANRSWTKVAVRRALARVA